MFGEHPNGSPEMGKVVTDWHCDRLKKMIEQSGGKIVMGGRVDRDIKYVEPTIIVNPSLDSECMREEIFGPVIPVVTYDKFDEVIRMVNEKDKPLAVYYFGASFNNSDLNKLIDETSSGALVVNDCLF